MASAKSERFHSTYSDKTAGNEDVDEEQDAPQYTTFEEIPAVPLEYTGRAQ